MIEIRLTEDGSQTLYNPQFGETYHSTHGAVQESRHVFIEAGLTARLSTEHAPPLRVLELGFGSGLNALMTMLYTKAGGISLHYTTLELYPLAPEVYERLSFPLGLGSDELLSKLHRAPWGNRSTIDDQVGTQLEKYQVRIEDYDRGQDFDVIYFDAFSPETQPELWTEELFARLYTMSRRGAILTTYCAKGEVRRRLARAGWQVERLAGPPGKREMLRASKGE